MGSQTTGNSIGCLTHNSVYQRLIHQSSAWMTHCDSSHNWPIRWRAFPCHSLSWVGSIIVYETSQLGCTTYHTQLSWYILLTWNKIKNILNSSFVCTLGFTVSVNISHKVKVTFKMYFRDNVWVLRDFILHIALLVYKYTVRTKTAAYEKWPLRLFSLESKNYMICLSLAESKLLFRLRSHFEVRLRDQWALNVVIKSKRHAVKLILITKHTGPTPTICIF